MGKSPSEGLAKYFRMYRGRGSGDRLGLVMVQRRDGDARRWRVPRRGGRPPGGRQVEMIDAATKFKCASGRPLVGEELSC